MPGVLETDVKNLQTCLAVEVLFRFSVISDLQLPTLLEAL